MHFSRYQMPFLAVGLVEASGLLKMHLTGFDNQKETSLGNEWLLI